MNFLLKTYIFTESTYLYRELCEQNQIIFRNNCNTDFKTLTWDI